MNTIKIVLRSILYVLVQILTLPFQLIFAAAMLLTNWDEEERVFIRDLFDGSWKAMKLWIRTGNAES